MPTIKLTKVNILGKKYYSTFRLNDSWMLQTNEITEQEYVDASTTIPVLSGYTYVSSAKKIAFDTFTHDLSDKQYATQENGFHWVKIPKYKIYKINPEYITNDTLSQAGIDFIQTNSEPE